MPIPTLILSSCCCFHNWGNLSIDFPCLAVSLQLFDCLLGGRIGRRNASRCVHIHPWRLRVMEIASRTCKLSWHSYKPTIPDWSWLILEPDGYPASRLRWVNRACRSKVSELWTSTESQGEEGTSETFITTIKHLHSSAVLNINWLLSFCLVRYGFRKVSLWHVRA